MAGVHFKYGDFRQLIKLNIGISSRLDENRAESLTILYCDFSDFSKDEIKTSLSSILRNSDSIVNYKKDYFFVLPYTDKYGADTVKNMFDEFFAKKITNYLVSYPADGEDDEELIGYLQSKVKKVCKKDLSYLFELESK
ncbi:hypothetical protein FJR48_11710 [Sulfurimonas lithotrophica]|uniref:Diguanylate cyclase n=1 Tax=Sulfurimonas lithotrophica TaxID=2590022 RepID=A0A5P8P3V1_9BACT|nr:hypothetical protein [Sulfurimonas lithotrophica]QFR50355.1 hypothetical protein FJR48_11710 [Sulfurimonas lithotrophica]